MNPSKPFSTKKKHGSLFACFFLVENGFLKRKRATLITGEPLWFVVSFSNGIGKMAKTILTK
jgi:hypothetical protein